MVDNAKILRENDIDPNTPNARKFLEIINRRQWDVNFFIRLSQVLVKSKDERLVTPLGRWKERMKR